MLFRAYTAIKGQNRDKIEYLYIDFFWVMNLFSYTLPKKISRDKDNKKWFLRYSITYKGEKTEYPKEYGKT